MGTRLKAALLPALLLACAPLLAAEVAGVKIEESARVAGAELKLNGAGLRTRAFFKVYAVGLYLPDRQPTGAAVLAAPGAKRVHLRMLRDVDADDFGKALEGGIKDNHSEAELKALAPRIAQLVAIMNEIKQAKTGLAIDLDWVPGSGTQVTIGGQPPGKPIAGEDFYRALLRIWVGENPVSGDLKKSLLGQGG
jgi:hypothetical protein